MKLLEYEAKSILKSYAVPTPMALIIDNPDSPVSTPVVLKSQVPVGGRGKAGGIRVVHDDNEVAGIAKSIFELSIKGYTPRVLLAEEPLAIKHEYYISLTINKTEATIELLAHKEGGIEIEEQTDFERWTIDGDVSATTAAGDELADYLEIPDKAFVLGDLIEKLHDCFIKSDATLLEINPLVLTQEETLVAADCKMILDDSARFRHPEWNFEDAPANANFVTLDKNGTVATIANGAGLAMATVDAVADGGLIPANFLDVGGGANEASVLEAFQKIMEYPNINAIVINIFAGITRCDEVAKAIISAQSKIPNLPKLYIRLAGTNYDEADTLLAKAAIPLLPSLASCLEAIQKDNT